MPHSPRGRRRTPYTAAGPVTTRTVHGELLGTVPPYSSREMRIVVEQRTCKPRRPT